MPRFASRRKTHQPKGRSRLRSALKITGIVVGSIVILVVALVAFLIIKNNIDSSRPILEDDYYKSFNSSSPLEERYSQRGEYDVAMTEFDPVSDASGTVRVWYPEALESNNETYPLISVVNGSNTPASRYEPYFERLASWGFIVVGTDDPQTGSGDTAAKTLDLMLDLPTDSVLHDRVDASSVGVVGYSQGGSGALRAVTEFDNSSTYKTMFTGSAPYALLAMTQGWEYDASKITIPYFMTAGTGTSDDRGVGKSDPKEFAGVSPLFGLEDTYQEMPDDMLKVRARAAGAEHEDMLARSDGYLTAWMLYELRGDEEASAVFLGPDAEIISNGQWQDVEKNQ